LLAATWRRAQGITQAGVDEALHDPMVALVDALLMNPPAQAAAVVAYARQWLRAQRQQLHDQHGLHGLSSGSIAPPAAASDYAVAAASVLAHP